MANKSLPLTDREKQNVMNRKSLLEQHQYTAKLIESDLDGYVLNVICPRYGIPKGVKVRISDDISSLLVDDTVAPVSSVPGDGVKASELVDVKIVTHEEKKDDKPTEAK